MTRAGVPWSRRVALPMLVSGLLLLVDAGPAGGFGYLTEWGRCDIRPGEELQGVQSIAAASNGKAVYVAERSGSQRVHAFNASGRLLGTMGSPYAAGLDEVNVGPAPDSFYVAYSGQFLRPEIRRFKFGGGRFSQVAAWGPGAPSSGSYFRYPKAVLGSLVSGGSSSLELAFVQDWATTDSGGLVIFDSTGNGLGSDLGGDAVDSGVALTGISGATANVVAAEAPLGRPPAVAHFAIDSDPSRRFLTTRLIKRWRINGSPVGIAYTRGALWVAVTRFAVDGNAIQVFTPSGGLVAEHDASEVPGGLAGLNGIAADAAGNVYVSDGSRVIKLGPGGGLPRSGGGSDSAYAEICGPEFTLRGRGTQRILRRGGVIVSATPDDRVKLVASGTVSVPGASKVFRLKKARKRGRAYRRTKFKLKLTRRARGAIEQAFARQPRLRLKARVRVRARDPAGSRSVATGTIRLKR